MAKAQKWFLIHLNFLLAKTKQDGELFLKIVINFSFLYAFICLMLLRHFRLYPNRADHFGFFIYKDAADSCDFSIEMKVSVKTSEAGTASHHEILKDGADLCAILGWGQFLKTEDIFNEANKYLADDTLAFIIDVSFCFLFY
jgi:hypothetical protein